MIINPLRDLEDDPLPALSPEEGGQLLADMVHELEVDEASWDLGGGHVRADDILLAVLLNLGYSEIVRLYERLPKLYV